MDGRAGIGSGAGSGAGTGLGSGACSSVSSGAGSGVAILSFIGNILLLKLLRIFFRNKKYFYVL